MLTLCFQLLLTQENLLIREDRGPASSCWLCLPEATLLLQSKLSPVLVSACFVPVIHNFTLKFEILGTKEDLALDN